MAADEKLKILRTVRGKDLKIRYTQDNLLEGLINQRQFYDSNGQILVPITPKLLERQIIGNNSSTIFRLAGIKPRTVTVCFGSAVNASAKSNFSVLIPYAPNDASHNDHLREIFSFLSPSLNIDPPFPLNISYQGENQI